MGAGARDGAAGVIDRQVTPAQQPERRASPPPREPAPTVPVPLAPPPTNVNSSGGLLTEGVNEATGGSGGSGGVIPVSPDASTSSSQGTFLPLVGLNNGSMGSDSNQLSKGDVGPAAKPDAAPSAAPPAPAASQPAAPSNPSRANDDSKREASRPPAAPARIEYIISERDTFVSIADEWFGDDTKWSLIARENPTVDPQKLKIGQKIFLPPKEAGLKPVEREPVLAQGERLYTVQSGDTLIAIARDELADQTRWEDIYAMNKGTIGSNSAALKVGMKLKLPKK